MADFHVYLSYLVGASMTKEFGSKRFYRMDAFLHDAQRVV